MMIAKAEPMTGIQSGTLTGRLNAKRSPVTAALQSPTVTGVFVSFCQINSDRTADATLKTVIRSALGPKYSVANINIGIREKMTSRMIEPVEYGARIWGEMDM